MNTQEKASSLIWNYLPILNGWTDDSKTKLAKKCALIACDELIQSYKNYTGMHDQDFFDSEVKYWMAVKEQIILI